MTLRQTKIPAPSGLSRADIQAVADMRMIAMALVKIWDGALDKRPLTAGLKRIQSECEAIIAKGPPGLVHIIDEDLETAEICRALTASVFGDRL